MYGCLCMNCAEKVVLSSFRQNVSQGKNLVVCKYRETEKICIAKIKTNTMLPSFIATKITALDILYSPDILLVSCIHLYGKTLIF